MDDVSKYLREPLVQFLLFSVLIYGAYGLWGASNDEDAQQQINISEEQVAALAAMWDKRWNRPPTDAELVGLVRAWLREEVLYREALSMGLDQDDHIIRRRLAQKLEFLTADIVELREPADTELQAYLEKNLERFRGPDRVTFTHVFFNPDKRGAATLDDAAATLERLQSADGLPETLNDEGDRFMLQNDFEAASELDVRRAMGSDFAASVMQLEPGRWHGPVLSGFGTHLVYVQSFDPAPAPELANVRDVVLREWWREQTEEFEAEFLETLKTRYDIVIEGSEAFAASVLESDGSVQEVALPDGPPGT